MPKNILIIDDEKSNRTTLESILKDEGYFTFTAENGVEGLKALDSHSIDICLLDIWMPKMDGIETLKNIKELHPEVLVIMMSGHGTIETAVKATKIGAYDFIEKPLSLEKLLLSVSHACHTQDLSRENSTLRKKTIQSKVLIGESAPMTQIKEMIHQVAPTHGSVLITGENGTGKEMIAQSIHALSNRSQKPFIAVNCAAIPDGLIESELFGHERGAFTGASRLKKGKFDLADGGTLFIDEIGDMSLNTQAKILRVIQEQKFERVGGSYTIEVNVRIIAATNKNLETAISQNLFREDLYYRLNVIPFHIPELKNRIEDIPLLVEHFLSFFSQVYGKEKRPLTVEALKLCQQYTWPGNIRELKNLMERIVILTKPEEGKSPITPAILLTHFKDEDLKQKTTLKELSTLNHNKEISEIHTNHFMELKNLKDARAEFEKEFILRTLKECEGNVSKTAQTLGVERSHLHKKIKSYDIEN